jgi:putative heme degradation protein
MHPCLQGQNFDSAKEFMNAFNKARKANPKQWLTYTGTVAGVKVEIKTFDHTDLQIVRINGLQRCPKQYDMNVTQWREQIEQLINMAAAVQTIYPVTR